LLEGYGLIIIERVIASKAKQSFTVRLPRRYCRVATLLAVTGKKSFDTLQLAAGRFICFYLFLSNKSIVSCQDGYGKI
jgi:hypothetical protein